MPSLTKLGLTHTRLTVLFMALILSIGLGTYVGFPKREDPAITVRTAVVIAANQGLSLGQLEELVARPLEETARSIPGVDEVRTQLTSGVAILQVDIATTVAEENLGAVFREIEDDIDAAGAGLPSGTQGPVVDTDFGDVAIATIAVTADGFSSRQTERFAEDLRDRLYGLDAVSAVTLYGAQEDRIWLEVDRDRLASVGTTITPLVNALQAQNVRLPAGSLLSGGQRVPLETSGDFRTLDDIRDLMIEVPDVGLLRLSDLVTVRRGPAEPVENPVYFNGQPSVLLAVEMYAGEDIVRVGNDLRQMVDTFQAEQPWGVSATFSTFQPAVVEASVNNALINMMQTFAVVLLVMFAFLGLRQALVIASIVPFAVAFAFAFMPVFGVELQQVSIAAIIISLGLLVDNGLVIIEDMDRRIRDGAERREAALQAGRQYTAPLLIASITTIAAFLPLFLLDGTEGQYGFSLGAVVALMLTGSFLSAVYLLPTLAIWLLPEPKAHRKRGLFDRLAAGYGWIIARLLRVPVLTLLVTLGIVASSLSLMPQVRQQLFPLSERSQFLIYLDLPRGADISETQRTALKLSDWLTDQTVNAEVESATAFIGFGGPRFVLTLDPADTDPASAFFVVNTTSFVASGDVIQRAERYTNRTLPNARVRLKRLAMGGREPGIEVTVSGPDADVLLSAAYQIEEAFAAVPSMVENQGDWGNRQLRGQVIVAQDRARAYNLSSQTVSDALAGFFDGTRISTFREGDREIPILLRGAGEARDSFEDLANVAIATDSQIVALDQIADLEPMLEFSTLRRVDQRRTITISAISNDLTALGLVDHIQPTLDRISGELGPAYTVNIGGEVEQSDEVRTKLGAGFPAAITVMLLALTIQFNSFRRVGLTLACVPLVIAGVPLALIGFNQPLSFFGTLGLIALSGIIINNAIVLIDQIDIEREKLDLNAAIAEAARKRFRPILLTSLTTVLGLLPMALSGGALWEPMATLMIGGLGVASVLTLFYVPALYRVLFHKRTAKAASPRQMVDPLNASA